MKLVNKSLFDEASFIWMLRHERRRTDRSNRPFLLLLIEFKPLPRKNYRGRRTLVNKTVRALKDCSRQTDIIGWYKAEHTIGIILTELHQEVPAISKILERVKVALHARLLPEQIEGITITHHLYPPPDTGTSMNNGAPNYSANDKLYPDLNSSGLARYGKRIIDLLGGLSLLILLAPVFVLIGVAIKLTSKGPILYKQTRIGQFGQPFTFLKFRSMYTDADENVHKNYIQDFILCSMSGDGEPDVLKQDGLFKLSHDDRVTPLGHFIRMTSLDELPQLFNIFRGNMSLVGPRPPIPYEVECYDAWHLRRVLEVRPGITGLWQVQGRSRTTFDDMVRLDLKYIDEWSIRADLTILLRTPWAVLWCEGAR